ncbi:MULTISPECIES: twin-arginine translocation signal domain-containing protein [Halorussus]|uniref:twin-arginine translocation signal domain-containing protein n=1 Tax=Halorussus TaxID=1070314 RepID=UPI0020A1361B|nr:twin-arginine translocation signal domain-containing protein [Halorussus vallis]USZ74441.1 twin-arginine translocation signal domain-containing protein [Halorussus vallis]
MTRSSGSDSNDNANSDVASRRSFLLATGAVGAATSLGGLAAGQGTTTGQETTTAGGQATTILLGGEVEHWFGLAPSAIHGAENPTLQLQSGQRYEIVWMNLDGHEHELIIEDANGGEIVASESNEQMGATASLTFTASEEMAQYYCEYHPKRMRGDIQFGTGFETTTAGGTTTAANGTTTDGGGGGGGY